MQVKDEIVGTAEAPKPQTKIKIVWYFGEGIDEVHGRDITACLVTYVYGNTRTEARGVAIRNPSDHASMLIGMRESLTDAMRANSADLLCSERRKIWNHALWIWREKGLLPKRKVL